jgi:LPS export ABC transporter protein LptC
MSYKKIWLNAGILFLLSMLFSCENDIDFVKSYPDPVKAPDLSLTNMETLYSDSGKLKVRMVAPLLNKYETEQKNFSEFPKGIHVYFYNDSLNVKAEISAKYAIYYEKTKLWEARNDVIVINTKGDRLNTEQLFWDSNKKIIYTKKYCRVTKPDGFQQIGEQGMEAQQDFENWKFFGGSGILPVKDEEQ